MAAGKKKARTHLSLSDVQKEAEECALELIRAQPGYSALKAKRVTVGDGYCQPDGVVTSGSKKIVEVYAKVGALKGAQSKKVATDILKFATIRRQAGYEKARCELYFVDHEARDSVRGWMNEAAGEFGVALKVVPGFPSSMTRKLLAAQKRQADGSAGRTAAEND